MAETTAAPRIAFLIQGLDAPSTRIRVLNLLPHFQAANFQTHVEVYPNSIRDWRRAIPGIRGADILVIQKRLPSLLESLFVKRLARRVAFDFDDSVWLRNRQGDARPSRKLQRRFKHFLRQVDLAVCGNPILEDYLHRQCPLAESVVIPSSVPAPEPPVERTAGAPLRVGWVGTEINLPYLVAIEPALIAAHARVPFELTVICSAPPRFARFPHVRFVPWSERTEYEHIRQFDAGLMPLADNEHSRGKCAYKALQYMSGGVPVIASDVGINREWIEKPGAGVVVSPDGWTDALVKVLSSDALRAQMGCRGIEAIRNGFRQEDVAMQYVRAFRRLTEPR
jgi:glycosyltransferase involved in cell wall biosynthesis